MSAIPAAALTAALLLPLTLHAQTTRDFSGTWTMDTARSQSAQQGEAIKPITCVITQSGTQVRIETTRGGENENVLYPLTKTRAISSSVSASAGHPEAYWDGDKLVTETQRPVNGYTVTVKETRTLAPAGEMTVETTVIVQHGYSMAGAKNYGNSTDVFVRAKQ